MTWVICTYSLLKESFIHSCSEFNCHELRLSSFSSDPCHFSSNHKRLSNGLLTLNCSHFIHPLHSARMISLNTNVIVLFYYLKTVNFLLPTRNMNSLEPGTQGNLCLPTAPSSFFLFSNLLR